MDRLTLELSLQFLNPLVGTDILSFSKSRMYRHVFVSERQVWWSREDEVDTDVCISNPEHTMKCQLLKFLPFRAKCIWRCGTQGRSRNDDQEGPNFSFAL